MRSLCLLVIVVCLVASTVGLKGSGKVANTFIGPHLTTSKVVTRNVPNGFSFNYVNTSPNSIKAVLAEAGQLWSNLIEITHTINVNVEYLPLEAQYLAACSSASCSPGSNLWNPSPLLKQTLSNCRNNVAVDMLIFINSNVQWDTRIGVVTPDTSKYNLLTVLMHEIGHGLGMSGMVRMCPGSTNTMAYNFNNSLPNPNAEFRFDQFLYDGVNNLETVLSSKTSTCSNSWFNKLRTNGVVLSLPALGNLNAALAVMHTDNTDALTYHLHETTYPPGTCNSLMTPYLDLGEVALYPGPLTLRSMAAIGWDLRDGAINADACNDVVTTGGDGTFITSSATSGASSSASSSTSASSTAATSGSSSSTSASTSAAASSSSSTTASSSSTVSTSSSSSDTTSDDTASTAPAASLANSLGAVLMLTVLSLMLLL